VKLSQCIAAVGYEFVLCAKPGRHRDRIGKPDYRSDAASLSGGRVAVVSDCWDHAYSASHEIAESQHGFKHSELMFCTQSNILAAWHGMRSRSKRGLAKLMRVVPPKTKKKARRKP